MAEFDFFGSWLDSEHILQSVAARGDISFILDIAHERPEPMWFREITRSVMEKIECMPRLFLFSDRFSVFPVCFRQQQSGQHAGKYFVSLERSGPGLSLTLPGCYLTDDGMFNLNTGDLFYPKEFKNPTTGLLEPPSDELKRAFKDIRSLMKKQLVRYQVRSWIHIGPDAVSLLRRKKARIVAKGV